MITYPFIEISCIKMAMSNKKNENIFPTSINDDSAAILEKLRKNLRERGRLDKESLSLDVHGLVVKHGEQSIYSEILDQSRTHKKFTIGKGDDAVIVEIPKMVGGSYGTYVWPCALVLSHYIWDHRLFVNGKNILEIGAGTSLPGLTAAKLGGKVQLSESTLYPDALEHAKMSCFANDVTLPVKSITWGEFDPDIFDLGPLDVILGSDCFFNTAEFEDVIMTVSFILNMNPSCQFWCSYHERSSNWNIEWLLHSWDLVCHEVELPVLPNDAFLPIDSLHVYVMSLSSYRVQSLV